MRGYKVVAPMNWAAGRESAKTRSAQQRRRAIRRKARQSYSGRPPGVFWQHAKNEKTPPGDMPNGVGEWEVEG